MKSLNFEEIDVGSTPLSTMRSCSEFHRYNSLGFSKENEGASEGVRTRRSIFSMLFGSWRKSSTNTNNNNNNNNSNNNSVISGGRGNLGSAGGGGGDGRRSDEPLGKRRKVKFRDADEASFYIESYRSSSSSQRRSDFDDEMYQVHERHESIGCLSTSYSASSSSSSANGRRHISSLPGWGCEDNFRSVSYLPSEEQTRAIQRETTFALDFLFGGFGPHRRLRKLPMEIELRSLRRGGLSREHSTDNLYGAGGVGAGGDGDGEPGSDRLTTSDRSSFTSQSTAATDLLTAAEPFSIFKPNSWRPAWNAWSLNALQSSRQYVMGPDDDFFYENIRIQPFATGGYLRGMLVAGFMTMFFNAYNLLLWPEVDTSKTLPHHRKLETMLYGWLFFQLCLNLLILPSRIRLHMSCWESSRSVEVETANNILRHMVQGDTWLLNRLLGRMLAVVSILTLVCGDAYLFLTPQDDPLRIVVVSLCSTNLLAFVARVILATAFSLSMHDPQVLADARRRGLSKWDLEVLPTFFFSHIREITNQDCSICLSTFDIGEMLISLPCDKKHNFHAACIRQWLERQNSCPLCQKVRFLRVVPSFLSFVYLHALLP